MAFKKVRFATKTQEKILSPVDSASLSQCSSAETDYEDGMPRQCFSPALRIPPLAFEDISRTDLEHNSRENHSVLPERPQAYDGVMCRAKEPVTVGLGILYSETDMETDEAQTPQSLLSDPVWWTMPRWEFDDYSKGAGVSEGMLLDQPANDDQPEKGESSNDKPKDSTRAKTPPVWDWDTMPFGPSRDQIIGSGYDALGSSSSSSSSDSSSISSVRDSGCAIRPPTESELDAEMAYDGLLCGGERALRAEQNRLSKIPTPLRCFFRRRRQLHLRRARRFNQLPVAPVPPSVPLNDSNNSEETAEARGNYVADPIEVSNSENGSRNARAVGTSHSIELPVASEAPDNIDTEGQKSLSRRCLTRKATVFWIVVFFCVAFAASWGLVVATGMLKSEDRGN